MSTATTPAEIIDLTTPPTPHSRLPEVIEVVSDDGDEHAAGVQSSTPLNGDNGDSKRKKRRQKKRRGKVTAVDEHEGEEGEIEDSSESLDADSKMHDRANTTAESSRKSLAERLATPSAPSFQRAVERDSTRRDGRDREKAERYREKDERRDRKRDRGQDRDRDRGAGRDRERRRSRSPRRDKHDDPDQSGSQSRRRYDESSRTKPPNDILPFFEDVKPVEVPTAMKIMEKPEQSKDPNGSAVHSGLLLPKHVSLLDADTDDTPDDTAAPNLPTSDESEDDDYIDYLDYDDDRKAPGMIRYFEPDKLSAQETKATKKTRFVCKNCGAEGDHKTFECPVLICLTCGARDEHSTRSCPISKTCFTCGMKGHINKTCPNRAATRAGAFSQYEDCDRCGSRSHHTKECPTLWRIYDYVEDHERLNVLRVRDSKRHLPLGQGGEGYIASDEWCYNCGACGHLGDDCTERPTQYYDGPREPSAFGLYNILSGPFSADAALRPTKRAPRDWEAANYGETVPMDVGKQGRHKERKRMEKRAREIAEEEEDPDDWFGARSLGNPPRGPRNGSGGSGGTSQKIKFGFNDSGKDERRSRSVYDPLPGPSRETDSIHIRGAASRSDRDKHHGPSYSKSRYDNDPPRGPRYRGGYSR